MSLKKVLSIMAVLTLAASGTAWAQALGPHMDGGSTNPCKICHDTASGDPALKGWNGGDPAGPSTGWGAKALSALCFYCHDTNGGTLTADAHDMESWAYNDGSHQYTVSSAPLLPENTADGALAASNLPYVATAELECTSCHNVHVSTIRPFNQRASYSALCDSCHDGRVNDAPAVGTDNSFAGAHDYSTHPTGVAFGSTSGRANIKALAAVDAQLQVATAAAPGYSIGGHVDNGQGSTADDLNCQTCHAVHGDLVNGTGIQNLLAIDNYTTGGGASVLCEGCHYGGDAGQQVGTLTAADPRVVYSDHPIDSTGNRAFYPTGATLPTALGGGWETVAGPPGYTGAMPDYVGASAPMTAAPVCSTCHDAHGGISATPLLRGPQAAGDWTMDYDTWCFACHTNTQVIPNNHHSVVNNWATSQLSCGDCHGVTGQTDWTAHNGFWAFEVAVSDTDSAFCEECHTPYDPTALSASALKGQDFSGTALADFPASHGAHRDTGSGSSHQVGVRDGSANIVIKTDAWASSGGISEWGDLTAGSEVIICESCHNILTNGDSTDQGLARGWEANLLLQPYEDTTSGTAGVGDEAAIDGDFYDGGNTGDALCRGCHAYTGTGTADASFVHNPEAHTVDTDAATALQQYTYTYAPYGRTTATVLTGPTASYPDANCPDATTADTLSAPNEFSYPAADNLDCDSCHRPHNADVDSLSAADGKYRILEFTDANYGTTPCMRCHNTDQQCNQ